jgi:two-component system cell cycle sensor histidine kinase PleC
VQAELSPTKSGTEVSSASIPRRRSIRLIHSFLVLGGIVVLLGTFALTYLHRTVSNNQFISLAEQNNAALTQAFANAVWPKFQWFLGSASRRNPDDIRLDPTTEVLRHAMRDLVQGTNVLKIKIYDTRGRTIFSTDPKQIGSDYSKNERFLAAMDGRTVSDLEKRAKFQSFNGELKNVWILSSYIAIRPSGANGASGNIVGVAETYTDVSDIQAQLDNTGSLLVGASAIVLLVVFIFLAAIVWVAERVMHRQHAHNIELAEHAARAAAASRAKSEFLANMSHELRTPLNAILGFAELITSEILGPVGTPRYKEYAGDIQRSGRHLLGIINDVLDLVQIETGRARVSLERDDVSDLARDVVRLMSRQAAAKNVALRFAANCTADPIGSDEGKIRQILFNLISNALKFTPEGGSVTVTVNHDPTGDRTVLRVADTGIGMRPEDVPVALASFGQIGNAFQQNGQGIGLGLPLTKKFAELLGGTFDIESAPGKGTTVTIALLDRQYEQMHSIARQA